MGELSNSCVSSNAIQSFHNKQTNSLSNNNNTKHLFLPDSATLNISSLSSPPSTQSQSLSRDTRPPKMLLKRKRSDDELSCFSSSGIGYSSPMRSETGDVVMMDMDIHSPTAMLSPMSRSSTPSHRSSTPSHLHSRTFKRLRNGRPSDEEVHRKFCSCWL